MSSMTGLVYNVETSLAANIFLNQGHHFSGWSLSDGGSAVLGDRATVSGATFGLSHTNKTVTLYATWEPNSYTVTFNPNGSGAITPTQSKSVTFGSAYGTLPMPTREKSGRTPGNSYRFDGWFTEAENGTKVEITTPVALATNHTLYAHWTEKFMVKWMDFDSNTVVRTDYPLRGSGVTPPTAPLHTGWTFQKWEGIDGFTNITQDRTYFAKYESKKYTIRFHSNFGTDQTKDMEALCTASVTLNTNEFARVGYTFEGWSDESDSTFADYDDGEKIDDPLLQDIGCVELYAVWAPITYKVEFLPGTGSGDMSPQMFEYDDAQALASNTFTNGVLDFVGWLDPGSSKRYSDGEVVSNLTATANGTVTLQALWNSKYFVEFDGNGATSGEMQRQAIVRGVPTSLSANAFVRPGYTFMGWAELPLGKVEWADCAPVTDIAESGETKKVYARWSVNQYTVEFYANGGLGSLDADMTQQSFVYDLADNLDKCEFVRPYGEFVGWATDPSEPAIYADEALVSNLCMVANGTLRLYAKWQGTEGVASELEEAADCGETTADGAKLNITTNYAPMAQYYVDEGDDKGGNGKYIKMTESYDASLWGNVVELSTVLWGAGDFSFWYKTQSTESSGYVYFAVAMEESNDAYAGQVYKDTLLPDDWQTHSDWVQFTTNFTATTRKKIIWRLTFPYPNVSNDWAAVDCIRWMPTSQDVVLSGITYRLNDGTAAPDDIWDNATKTSGVAFTELPVEPKRTGYIFAGWFTARTGGTQVDETTQVGGDQTLYAQWLDDEAHQLAVPMAVEGLVYDGAAHTGVVAGVNYSISGNVATNAGQHVAVAVPDAEFIWKNGSSVSTQIVWQIAQAVYDMSGVKFPGATYPADGTAKSLVITGTLPEGVTVSYEGNGKSEPGDYTVTAKFSGDAVNYKPIADMKATLSIKTPVAVPAAKSGLVYDGQAKIGVAAGMGYALSGNVATNAGHYTATAAPLAGYCWQGGGTGAKQIAWQIAQAVYDMSGVTFPGATYNADGTAKSLAISGALPTGVTVSYEGNGKSAPGVYTVKAKFSGDSVNYAPIADMTAKLTILDEGGNPGPQQPTEIDVPAAIEGLVYDGKGKTGVKAGTGYAIAGNVATNAGEYVATATPLDGYSWKGGGTGATSISWSIAKGAYDMAGVTFDGATYVADGTEKSITVKGDLPKGVTVAYEGNGKTEPGAYAVKAKFSGDAANYEPIADMFATLAIVEAAEPEPVLYPDDFAFTPFAGNAAYVGWLDRDGAVAGLVTIKAGKANARTGLSAVTVAATPAGGKKWTQKLSVPAGAIRDVVSDAVALTFTGEYVSGKVAIAGVEYRVVAGADFFKAKDKSVKAAAKAKVPVGTWTFGFESGDGDFAGGSAAVAKSSGKTKFTICLADGTKVSVSSAGVYGAGMERLAVPVSYSKKGVSFGFVLWVGAGARISSMAGKDVDIIQPEPVRELHGNYKFELQALPSPYLQDRSPDGFVFSAAGTKWKFAKNDAALKLKWAKTGVVTGSLKLFYPGNGAKPKSDSAKFIGVAIGDKVHGAASVKRKAVYLTAGASPAE
ncbi:MAG: InlB B-repeat-containing protein [Kiritimatiellae bacterium]|nr:InlB B-repeat-containing protein [Kiritimatiellia bacterium]